MSHADDYVFGYYPLGWRSRDGEGDSLFAVQTSEYALLLNASRGHIERIGRLKGALSAHAAVMASNDMLERLPAIKIEHQVVLDGVAYRVSRENFKPDSVVIQRLGKYLVHVEVRNLNLLSDSGSVAEDVEATLHLVCWPDRALLRLTLKATASLRGLEPRIRIQSDSSRSVQAALAASGIALYEPVAGARHIMNSGHSQLIIDYRYPELEAGDEATIGLALHPVLGKRHPEVVPFSREPHPAISSAQEDRRPSIEIRATGIAPYNHELEARYDPMTAMCRIRLGENDDKWTMERVRVHLHNHYDSKQTLRLAFSKVNGGFAITGMSPVLCDVQGFPLGLPIQISKNWHVRPAWFDGVTILELDPKQAYDLEFRLAYAHWGGVPAASHAQLALEGWGTHQLWDQMAIGSFGESICYDPDVNLQRSMIDDMRPLMVWAMGRKPQLKWTWTHNVGGGDFLVLFQDGQRQFLGRQKTLYESYGPVLTDVTYAGETPGGAVQSRVRAQSWRSDDYVRAIYTLRYDVQERVDRFDRLAFFQLGADRYNHNLFDTVTRGAVTRDGHRHVDAAASTEAFDLRIDDLNAAESWNPSMGGNRYSRERLPMEGYMPWLAFTGATKNPPPAIPEDDQGAWANRGFIVRSWNARLGGKKAPLPHYSIYGTNDGGTPSAIAELSPPPGVSTLVPGDFVDAQIEMLILPQFAGDYYGPNERLRDALTKYPDQPYLVYREARGNAVRVKARIGTIVQRWPVVVRARGGVRAQFSIEGGLGYTPVTITGAKGIGPFQLVVVEGDRARTVEQSSPAGNDWWQSRYRPESNTWDLTFTLPLDSPGDERAIRGIVWTHL